MTFFFPLLSFKIKSRTEFSKFQIMGNPFHDIWSNLEKIADKSHETDFPHLEFLKPEVRFYFTAPREKQQHVNPHLEDNWVHEI